jgi:hypothetical protein
MKIANRAVAGFILVVLCLASCVSTNPAKTVIPEKEVRANRLYGYEIQTLFTGKRYVFAYGDIQVEGTITQYLNTAVQGISSKKIMPFRGNVEYTVDMKIGDDAISGKIKVELDCIRVDLNLNGTSLSGPIDFKIRGNSFDLLIGTKSIRGHYTYILRIAYEQLRTSDYSFDVCQGDLQLGGQITYKNDTYTYNLLLNEKILSGTSSFGSLKNVYTLDAEGLTMEELVLFFLVNMLKTIHYDMHRYHTR